MKHLAVRMYAKDETNYNGMELAKSMVFTVFVS